MDARVSGLGHQIHLVHRLTLRVRASGTLKPCYLGTWTLTLMFKQHETHKSRTTCRGARLLERARLGLRLNVTCIQGQTTSHRTQTPGKNLQEKILRKVGASTGQAVQ